jgi:PAS domain-containing protein
MDVAAIRVFAPQSIKFWRDSWQNVYVDVADETLGPLRAKRAFPLTAPQDIIVLEDCDGRFLGIVNEYEKMDAESVRILEIQLEAEFFLPQILKIYDIKDHLGLLTWRVETDRGPRQFEVRNRRRDIRWFSDTHVVVQDADGNKYEIADLSRLDMASRQKVEMEV